MTTDPFLLKHGTKAFELPASAIVGAARSDLALRERKHDWSEKRQEALLQPDRLPSESEDLMGRRYAFMGGHVKRAKSVADLIRMAMTEGNEWQLSSKISVQLIYGDRAKLETALKLAEAA